MITKETLIAGTKDELIEYFKTFTIVSNCSFTIEEQLETINNSKCPFGIIPLIKHIGLVNDGPSLKVCNQYVFIRG